MALFKVPQTNGTKVTKLAFKQRLTQQERLDIRAARSTDPIVEDFMDLVDSATYIDLSRSDTVNGVNYMEQQGLIGTGRANEILTDPVQDDEVPQ